MQQLQYCRYTDQKQRLKQEPTNKVNITYNVAISVLELLDY